jgi:ectoine hydroxylase-related dioxygenase (phytanoyl-CoA dioxygenase family)
MIDIERFEREGFFMRPSLLTSTESKSLIQELERSTSTENRRGGVRDVMDSVPALQAVASHPNVRTIVDYILGHDAHIVRSTLFDKTEASNWKVPWHQDVTIAIQKRIDTESYGPWSIKAGVHHVQPPTHVLARMLTVRIHLDPCPATNGALRVIPGTHHLGRLNQNCVEDYIDESRAVTCAAETGEALIMRPLLLHASSASAFPGHRRILHFDFASGNLDNGLTWRMR